MSARNARFASLPGPARRVLDTTRRSFGLAREADPAPSPGLGQMPLRLSLPQ